jgi:hypothetical protein
MVLTRLTMIFYPDGVHAWRETTRFEGKRTGDRR